ncbi:phage tail assembly chaperone [Peptostreptococcus stomatis]
MGLIDNLMKIDAGLVKKNEGTLVMKLKRIGKEMEFNCIEVDSEKATQLDEETLNMSMNGNIEVSTFNTKIKLILLGCKDLRDEGLRAHFSCQTPKDLIKKLMTKDEIEKLADFISNLGGLADKSEDEIEEIKN